VRSPPDGEASLRTGQRPADKPRDARRPGYAATATSTIGRRGARTRDNIKTHAAILFIANGYHATSIEAIAKAMGGSRATIYQYFTSKEDIYAELVRECEDTVLVHARTLANLGPTAPGLRNLRRWLREWADIYDDYAVVLLEFPGIGTFESLPVADAGPVARQFRALITERLTGIGITGLDPTDAASALMRISHMVNLYRFRGIFDLPSCTTTSDALAIALQLMLFPDTPSEVIAAGPRPDLDKLAPRPERVAESDRPAVSADTDDWPGRQDVLSVSSTLFAERGYYSVSMDEIAAAADVSRATLYRYFNSKTKVLAELTTSASLHGAHLAEDLYALAAVGPDTESLHAWMSRYVTFHRNFSGVIRAWFDGSVAEQLSSEGLRDGIGALHGAVTALLGRATLPRGMNRTAAAAIFMAILGRMTEPSCAESPIDVEQTAAVMVLLANRSLLRFTPPSALQPTNGKPAQRAGA
jgi:AcrR family transcriptional regulator